MKKEETVDEFLQRGGHITNLNPSPTGSTEGAGLYETHPTDEPQMVRVVPWKELYEEVDPELDDPKYWKKLNERLDEINSKYDEKNLTISAKFDII